jgi:hypothetical protein
MNNLITISYKDNVPKDYEIINVTSRGSDKWRGFSPFITRPFYHNGVLVQNIENFWQFSKVYDEHLDSNNNIKPEWFEWRLNGWKSTYAHRYPMGKGRTPKFLYWEENNNVERLNYIDARKRVYFPYYTNSIKDLQLFKDLQDKYLNNEKLAILDFDVYRFDLLNMSIDDVINCETKKAGHGFAIYKLLTINEKPNSLFTL